jgi:hypothetical protein
MCVTALASAQQPVKPVKNGLDPADWAYLKDVGGRPVLFVVAQNEQLFKNADNAYAAAEVLTGPKQVLEVPGITHFEMYIDAAFEISSNAAAAWFIEHFN